MVCISQHMYVQLSMQEVTNCYTSVAQFSSGGVSLAHYHTECGLIACLLGNAVSLLYILKPS